MSKWRGMRYSPKTGMLYSPRGPILALSGGYRCFGRNLKNYRLHSWVWEQVNGPIPSGYVIDHTNRNPLDNRLCNLRCVTFRTNSVNVSLRKDNKSGYKGVSFAQKINKWVAQCRYMGKKVKLGYFLVSTMRREHTISTCYPQGFRRCLLTR